MSRRTSSFAPILAVLLAPVFAQAGPRWKMQFFYDKDNSSLDIVDLQCTSSTQCVGAGVIEDKKGHARGTVLVTSDGGQRWSLVDVHEEPVSLFFLNPSLGWLVTERGVWSTNEGGRSWQKLLGLKKGLQQVYFLTPLHGYAIGFPKLVYETIDGGKKWSKLSAAEQPPTLPNETTYNCIAFDGQHGLIAGNVAGQDFDESPVWLNPREARFHREQPSTLAVLETMDGGAHWNSYTASYYGSLTQLKLAKDGSTVALFQYRKYYSLPSRLYKGKFPKGMESILAERDLAVSDIELLPDGGAVLAAIEPPGASNQIPIPGKLKMLGSKDLKVWEEMEVDYRAVAQSAVLAGPDAQHLWVATDTGMILALDNTAKPAAANSAQKP